MSQTEPTVDLSHEVLRLPAVATRVTRIAAGVGGAGLIASLLLGFSDGGLTPRFFSSYLVNFSYFLSLTLGALFFVLIQHVTLAGWSVAVRRFAEVVAATAPQLALLSIPLFLGLDKLYPWAVPGAADHDALLAHKAGFLNPAFFAIRLALCFIIWTVISRYFLNRSTDQDASGDPGLTQRLQRLAAPALYAYALTITFSAFDLLMSLDPHWYSTIFGVYYFSGGILGFFALLPVMTAAVQRSGYLVRLITTEHYHDMGKLVFAFTVFWAYIAFSQYLLIWYADIPEETTWYLRRITGSWTNLSWFLLFGHFMLPFVGLLSRVPKRRRGALVLGSVWILAVHWIDLYWIVMPEMGGHGHLAELSFDVLDLTCFLGVGGMFVAAVGNKLRTRALIPEKDPRLGESLAFENF
ncbi:MAG: quinol:cytochrome C oxidoreductase [Gemmatimonadota bacterium]|nr:quinol:cytochrome C oxidoreductase [Gemmatimonadota bacterium]